MPQPRKGNATSSEQALGWLEHPRAMLHASLPTELVLEDERHVSEQLDIAVPEKKLDGLTSCLLQISGLRVWFRVRSEDP